MLNNVGRDRESKSSNEPKQLLPHKFTFLEGGHQLREAGYRRGFEIADIPGALVEQAPRGFISATDYLLTHGTSIVIQYFKDHCEVVLDPTAPYKAKDLMRLLGPVQEVRDVSEKDGKLIFSPRPEIEHRDMLNAVYKAFGSLFSIKEGDDKS